MISFARFVTVRALDVLEDSFESRQLHGGWLWRREMPFWSPISPKRTLGRRRRFGANVGGRVILAFGCAVVAGTVSGKDVIGGSGGGGCVSGIAAMTVRVGAALCAG